MKYIMRFLVVMCTLISIAAVTTPALLAQDNSPPQKPNLISPPNNANILDTTPTFQWTSVSDPSGVTYQIQVDYWDPNFNPPVYYSVSGLVNNTHTLPDENALILGRYYWHVRATNGVGEVGEWSETWGFMVVPVGAIGALLMSLALLLPFALVLWRRNKRCHY